MRRVSIEIWPADPELGLVPIDPLPQLFACRESLQTGLPLDAHEIDGKEYAAKRGGRPPTARKVANGEGASGAKPTASTTQPPAHKIAKNEDASGAKSTASTQPPAHDRKKTKRAAIQPVSKAAGMVVHSSLQ